MVVDLFKVITGTFKQLKVGPEILEWVTGAGQETFVEKFLIPLGKAYQESLLTEPAPLRMKANLDADPTLPFKGAMFDGTNLRFLSQLQR